MTAGVPAERRPAAGRRMRVGSHSRYGFGELRVEPIGELYQEQEENV